MVGMNGMKNVKLEPLIAGMAANGPFGGRWIDWQMAMDGLIGYKKSC